MAVPRRPIGFVVAHVDALAVMPTVAEAVTRGKVFADNSGKTLVVYALVEVYRVEPTTNAPNVEPQGPRIA